MTTEHNNFTTVSSKEDALQYQSTENLLLKAAISDSIPASSPTELFGEND